ncbi:MAG: hypothetical protein KA792_10675, partial [Bacteroidales bacterium]|nr:hypothetical protein [Bacteroidales bacterium]
SLNIEEHPVPSTQTVCSGQKISYHIKVSDTTYTSYKWYKNGAFISGETNSAFVVQSAISNASYYCVATNSCGSITSNSASITVVPAAYILTDPVSKTVCENGVVNLRIIVSGIPLSYQWYRNNIMINNASTNQYIFNAKYSDMGNYYCVIANECGYDTSGVAIVKVNMPIQIVQQPYNLAKCFGEEAVFAFSLNDITGVTYQWLYNNINITGATNSEYKIETVDETNTGKYKCIATNACGTKTSNEVTLSVNSSFSIVSKSPNLSYCEGTDVKLFVETTGESVNYQWFKDEVEITGATNSSYYITNLYKASEGFYSCIVSNNCSSITNNIIVYVELKPQIYIAPLIQVKYVGDSVTYYLSPGGTGPFEYQWIKDDEPIENASESFYKIDSLVIDNSGKYTCIVSNKCGSTTVEISTLQVKYPEGFSIDGVLYYANVNNTPLTNTVVNLYNSEGVFIKTETTNNEGYYLFSGLSNGSYIVRPDIKKPWGGITPIDALLVNRYYLKIIPIKDILRLKAADVDKNGIINPIDALYINRRYLKIIRSFKAGDWIYEEKEIIINGTNINSNIRAICVGDVDVNYIPTLKKLKKYKK